jgi:hypothetical protein
VNQCVAKFVIKQLFLFLFERNRQAGCPRPLRWFSFIVSCSFCFFCQRAEIVVRNAILKIAAAENQQAGKVAELSVTKIVFFVLIVLGWQAEVQQLNAGTPIEIRRQIPATPKVLRAVGGQSGRNTTLLG